MTYAAAGIISMSDQRSKDEVTVYCYNTCQDCAGVDKIRRSLHPSYECDAWRLYKHKAGDSALFHFSGCWSSWRPNKWLCIPWEWKTVRAQSFTLQCFAVSPARLPFLFNRHRRFRSYDHRAASLKNLMRTQHWWHVLGTFALHHFGWIYCQIYRRILADTYKSRPLVAQEILRVHNVTVSGCC